jgi:hypothetical protein
VVRDDGVATCRDFRPKYGELKPGHHGAPLASRRRPTPASCTPAPSARPPPLAADPAGGAGGTLLLEGGGVTVNQGLAEDGEVLIEPTPGLEQQGKLVECRFTFPGQPERVAFVLFAPANP